MNKKDDTDKSVSSSLLPQKVLEVIKNGIDKGFIGDTLIIPDPSIDDSAIPEICKWLIKLGDKVTTLNNRLEDNRITSRGASILFDTLRVEGLKIQLIAMSKSFGIDDKCMKSLGEYIKSNRYIEVINMDNCTITDAGIEVLEPYFDGNTTFKRLYMMSNKGITDQSISHFIRMIETSHMEELFTNFTSISNNNVFVIPLAHNIIRYGAAELALFVKDINDDDLAKICEYMKIYGIEGLKNINFESNKLTSKGIIVLFKTLKQCNSAVVCLEISRNQLDDECIQSLGEFVQDNEHLRTLNLSYTSISDRGVEMLSKFIAGNTFLWEMAITGCKSITNASVIVIREMIMRSHILDIALAQTKISDEKLKEIREALQIPIDKRETPIKSNSKSASKISDSN